MNKNIKALEEYKKLKKQCLGMLRQIESGLEKNVEEDTKLHFGHVGSLYFIKDQLENICKFINL